jgi:hypothetical protein
MPAAKGKTEIRVVIPDALKAQLEREAAERGLDRSAWITMQLQSEDAPDVTSALAQRIDQVIRDMDTMREQLAQVITLIETFMAAVGKPSTPAEKVYPTPATWEETYPELYAPKPPAPTPAVVVVPQAPAKRWPWQR